MSWCGIELELAGQKISARHSVLANAGMGGNNGNLHHKVILILFG